MNVHSEYEDSKHLTQAYKYKPPRLEGEWLTNLRRLSDLNAMVEVT